MTKQINEVTPEEGISPAFAVPSELLESTSHSPCQGHTHSDFRKVIQHKNYPNQ